jgi:hypothetical protein
MELINNTPYPALMFKTGLDNNQFAMSVAVRITYDIAEDGKAAISQNQDWKLSRQLWQSDYGPIESDDVFRRGGVDIIILGSAKAPNNIPVHSMEVSVKYNNKTINKVVVFGDRFWIKSFLGMEISTPKPFTEMPITLANAYGGQADWDGVKIPFGNNPAGKGYHYAKEDYVGKALPNVENPDKLIRKYTDQPDPVGVACLPQLCEIHMRNNVLFDKEGQIEKLDPKFFNAAFPSMIVDKIKDGDRIVVTGMSVKPFLLKIPVQKIFMKTSLGEREILKEMYIEQIGIIPDKKQAFITYRCPINYTLVPLEIRTCEISI